MPHINVTLSANAGVCIEVGGKKIWVDALYADVGSTFSPLHPHILGQIMSANALGEPDYILYTHCHGDHYSRELTQAAMKRWPKAKVALPQRELDGQVLLSGGEQYIEDGALGLRFIKLPHAGAQYADVALYGLLISVPGCNILLPGDCEVASPALAQAIGEVRIDLAVLDFPWITKRMGREFLQKHIRPAHVLAYHLPFAEDDANGYRASAGRAAEAMGESLDVRLLCDPLQTEQINI